MKRWSVGWKMARRVFDKTNGRCVYCADELPRDILEYDDIGNIIGKTRQWHVDHATPLSRGGDYSYENLMPSCASCNSKKGNRTFEEFVGR